MSSRARDTRGDDLRFQKCYQVARTVKASKKVGDIRILGSHVLSREATCYNCYRFCDKALKCSACKMVYYCGKDCQTKNWKKHKRDCREYVDQVEDRQIYKAYLAEVYKKFPWSILFADGTTNHELVRAFFDVLGSGPQVGYWSWPERSNPHDDDGPLAGLAELLPTGLQTQKSISMRNYKHGEIMLAREWPDDVGGWKLEPNFIPQLAFSSKFPAPLKAQPGEVKDWESWYAWRGLPLDSPAAILLDAPLSVYHLLVNVLRVVDFTATETRRQTLTVHLLGAETELNLIPLFSELALLLSNVDLNLIFFSRAGHALVQHAKARFPGSIATRDIVWKYTAPHESGGGSLTVILDNKHALWGSQVIFDKDRALPDALIALNVGLVAYTTWAEAISWAVMIEIPWGMTDYEQTFTYQYQLYMAGLVETMVEKSISMLTQPYARGIISPKRYPAASNSFHRPGVRQMTTLLPYAYNGMTFAILHGRRVGSSDGVEFTLEMTPENQKMLRGERDERRKNWDQPQ